MASNVVATIEQLIAVTDVTTFCSAANATLKRLQQINDRECSRLEEECRLLGRQVEAASRVRNQAVFELSSKRSQILELEQSLEGHAIIISSLQSEIAHEHAEVGKLQQTINSERQRQSNAVYDLIPLHGLFSAIITGDAKRAIPFYSQIDGIVSAVENKLTAAERHKDAKESELRRLNELSDEMLSECENIQIAAIVLEHELDACNAKTDECTRNLKRTGQKLCEAQAFRKRLGKLRSTYEFLQVDVDLIAVLKDSNMMRQCIRDFKKLLTKE